MCVLLGFLQKKCAIPIMNPLAIVVHDYRYVVVIFLPETISRVAEACQVAKKTVWTLFEQGARTAVSCSYRIFNARASPMWDLSDLLK